MIMCVKNKSFFLEALIFFTFSVVLSAAPTGMREWTSADGRTLSADATAFQDGKVTLVVKGGKLFSLPLDKLSEADQAFVREHFSKATTDASKPAQPASILSLPLEQGKMHGPIKADDGAHYFVYLPKSLQHRNKYPLMYFTSPGGGNTNVLKRLIKGAELNGWIIACSKESRNHVDKAKCQERERSNDSSLKHLKSTLPIDAKRVYFGGSSGGGSVGFGMLVRHRGQGLISIVSGSYTPDQLIKGRDYFFINGAYDWGRYFAATDAKQLRKYAIQRFHPGQHNSGPVWMTTEAMVWLEGRFLLSHKSKHPEDVRAYEDHILDWIDSLKSDTPWRAYYWVTWLEDFKISSDNAERLRQLSNELKSSPSNVDYVAGLQAIDDFSRKYYAEMGHKLLENHTTSKIKQSVDKLAAQYTDTPWIKDVIPNLAKETDH